MSQLPQASDEQPETKEFEITDETKFTDQLYPPIGEIRVGIEDQIPVKGD